MSKHLIVLTVVLAGILLPASLAGVDLSLLNLEALEISDTDEMAIILGEEEYLKVYIPEEYWDAPRSKAEYIRILHLAESALDDSGAEGTDAELLRGLLAFYLHNLDDQGAFGRAEEIFRSLADSSIDDYRPAWFLADLYAKSAKPVESIDIYERIVGRAEPRRLHPLFWSDYAFCAYTAGMLGRARYSLLNWSESSGRAPEDHFIWEALEDVLIRLPAQVPPEEMFSPLERNGSEGLFSSPFGIWMPVREDWDPRYLPYNNGTGGVMFQSARIPDFNGRGISYSILAIIFIDNPEGAKALLGNFPDAEEVGPDDLPGGFALYAFSDDSLYPEAGGGRGMLALYHSPGSGEYRHEAPALLGGGEGLSYFRHSGRYLRPEGVISYVFLLDSAANIEEVAREHFSRFLGGLVID
jgi:hypothetical protein